MNHEARRDRVLKAMDGARHGVLAVAPGPNMAYLFGWHPHVDERPCYAFLTGRGTALVMPDLNLTEAKAHLDLPMEAYADGEGPQAPLVRLADRLSLAETDRVWVEDTMRYDFVRELETVLPGAPYRLSASLLAPIRARKDSEEVAALKVAAGHADHAMTRAFERMAEGMTEAELAKVIEEAFQEAGADKTNFTIVGSGANGAFPHHSFSDRRLLKGDAVVLDIGGAKDGYNGDLTRVAHIGEPTDEYRKVHAVVEKAVRAALSIIKPGVRAGDVDRAARGVIEEAGYGPYFTHRVGHGIGVTGHEPPFLTGNNDLPLEVGMTFSVEPGIYIPGRFGVRLEEIVALTDEGPEILSRLPRDVRVIS